MILTAEQAAKVFDILVETGNLENRETAYTMYKKEEFIERATEGINEYWYSTNYGASIKVYFDAFSEQPVWVYAQTFNFLKEATLVADTNAALKELVATERAKAQA